MRTPVDKLLNRVQRLHAYREVVISSAGTPIVLSVWAGHPDQAAVVFLPGTMTHPLFYEEFLDALNRTGLTVVGVRSQGHGKSPRPRQPLTFARILTNARDPKWLRHIYPTLVHAVRGAGQLAPRVPVPFDAYLDIKRVCRDEANAESFYTDPLGRRTYPLGFLSTLFSADLSGMRDGSIRCPVLVVAGRGDPLFPLSYTRQVYESILAPHKELLILESAVHLLFNEDLDVVLPPLLDRLAHLQGAPTVVPAGTIGPNFAASVGTILQAGRRDVQGAHTRSWRSGCRDGC